MIDLSIAEEDIIVKERPNKSAYKRLTADVAKFVDKLTNLSVNQLSKLGLPEETVKVIMESKAMKATGSRKRHLKHAINALLNDEIWSSDEARKQYDRVAKGNDGLKLPR